MRRLTRLRRRGSPALTRVLASRTSAELAEPIAVNPARDELAFYPLIYWPIVAGQSQPQPEARTRIAAYMKNGGTVVFDTRDALVSHPGGAPTEEALWLRALLAGVDVPELEPVPRDHVLTKTFYLLDRLVGRTAVGQTWIEALPPADSNDKGRPARAGDGVSPIIIASDDLAAAWASDAEGGPLFPLIPGGRPPARARLPQRHQSRDVHAHRQLQGRSGPRQGHHRKAHPLSVWSIAFSPFLPPWAIVALAAVALAITVVLVWRRVRGAWLRALAFALLILGLCDPNLVQENRRPLKDIVALVVDRSAARTSARGRGRLTRRATR